MRSSSVKVTGLASHDAPTLEETDDDGLPLLAALSQQRSAYDERLPQGAECQCADCGWLFGGLTGFDRHVSKDHADPLSLGLVARFRSAAVVWVQEYVRGRRRESDATDSLGGRGSLCRREVTVRFRAML